MLRSPARCLLGAGLCSHPSPHLWGGGPGYSRLTLQATPKGCFPSMPTSPHDRRSVDTEPRMAPAARGSPVAREKSHWRSKCCQRLLADEEAEAGPCVASCPKSTARIRTLICTHPDAISPQNRLPLLGNWGQPGPSFPAPRLPGLRSTNRKQTLTRGHPEPGLPGGGAGRPWPGGRDSTQTHCDEHTWLEAATPHLFLWY